MSIKLKIIESSDIMEYQSQFSNIEKSIKYPLDGGADSFTINHGNRYDQFFSNMGRSRFLIALESAKVCGSIAAVWKKIKINKKPLYALYIADLKIISKYRGRRIPLKMVFHALLKYIIYQKYKGWKFLYYIGMNGEKGNVTKSFRGFHLGRLSKSICNQKIYIINLNDLENLSHFSFKHNNGTTIELSPNNINKIITNRGIKDLTLQSSGKIMQLAHIHFQINEKFNHNISELVKIIKQNFCDYKLCFAVDVRNNYFINYLSQNKIESNTTCSIYTFHWPILGYNLNRHKFISLSTAEI